MLSALAAARESLTLPGVTTTVATLLRAAAKSPLVDGDYLTQPGPSVKPLSNVRVQPTVDRTREIKTVHRMVFLPILVLPSKPSSPYEDWKRSWIAERSGCSG